MVSCYALYYVLLEALHPRAVIRGLRFLVVNPQFLEGVAITMNLFQVVPGGQQVCKTTC